ncbi:Mu transposase C-terminal domain-containing protein [Leptolyngbya ohadii]|uniref:Mu transposase C-terminal domain-containing protein n=1 Tax=Leptolyngbya ohadii TaxID=1962290 RepID=UPI000B59D458|nr:Mu transposase C-terminal domain-containing protein [Leptolyngbya ohadii]
MAEVEPASVTESGGIAVWTRELTIAEQERVRAMQRLAKAPDRRTYLALQQEIAQQLGMTVRNVQNLLKAWERDGVSGVIRQGRSDEGEHRLSEAWERYIVETYRKGNRGGRRMSRSQVAVRVEARARELGEIAYPSRSTVYRVLGKEIEAQEARSRVRSVGWSGEELILRTRDGGEIKVERSNQVWQCDHTRVDLMVVDQVGEVLGRPWLTTVIDTDSRCIMGIHLGMESPSAWVVCLALRHAILPKQYGSSYGLEQDWGTYGLPEYLYTDGGKDFNSKHIEQVTNELKIVLHQRRYPAEGGIVERPFGTMNSELFATLPGYTGGSVKRRPKQVEKSACLTLMELEKHLVRYIVERYNVGIDPRIGDVTRMGRWESKREGQLPLMSDRELDICLMRRERRVVYRGGYIQFANLNYRGEHLSGYSGSWVVLRYNPRDITSILVYREVGGKDEFLSRAHAMGLETETLSYAEAKAMGKRLRASGRSISNQTMLSEVRSRDREVEEQQRRTPKRASKMSNVEVRASAASVSEQPEPETVAETAPAPIKVRKVRVYDYEAKREEYDLW